MKRFRALGGRMGWVVRRPRVFAALALPLAVPLFLAAVRAQPELGSVSNASIAPPPSLRYHDLQQPYRAELPEHALMLTIEKNDTLDKVLQAGGLSRSDSAVLAQKLGSEIDVRRLRPGHIVRFHYDQSGLVDAVQMRIPTVGDVNAVRNGATFDVTRSEAVVRREEVTVTASIRSSLYEAIREAGEGPQVVPQLIDVFQWDIDFFGLQKGDTFSFVVTKEYAGPDLVGYGPIKAARFTHKGTTYEAFRHENDGHAGYYSAAGAPLRKQFLKAPVKFSRVTSGFTKKRFHPVLKYFRPHYGVDYGAPVGTPVMTTADGVVLEARYKSGEGNFIRVRHTSKYETWYLHLSRFAKDLKRGSQVTQGDVIGYVGSTGLASGPHLDYRVRENGKWLDPLKLKSITPDPLRGRSLARFKANVTRLQPQLEAPVQAVAEKPVFQRALF